MGGDFRFDPVALRIERGASITWLNMGDFHTTTAFHPKYTDLISADVPLRIPEDAEPWHSGMLGLTAGTEYEHTFQVPGVYDYFCQPHYSFGMVGRIIVDAPRGGPAMTRPASELNQASRAVLPSVERIMGASGRAYEWAARINGLLLLRTHGAEVDPALGALQEGIRGDRRLVGLLKATGAGDAFGGALERFVHGVRSGVDYEELVARADSAKEALSRAIPTG